MKKRILSLLLCLCMVCSLLPGTALAAEQYDDVGGHWAESSIKRWSDYRIVEGSDGHFRPNASLTRGEMATILANTLGLTDEGRGNPFRDVAADAWYTPYILRCYTAGIMAGDGVNANPNATITRQEAMVMLCRALAIPEKPNADLSTYGDSANVANWAKGAVAAMIEARIVSGVGGNQLAPAAEINRASTVAILDRAIVQYINTPGSYTLTNRSGIILVAAAGDVTFTGRTSADILVAPAARGRTLTFDKATVTGAITIQADNMKVANSNSTLPKISAAGSNVVVENVKPAAPAGSDDDNSGSGGSWSGGGSGGTGGGGTGGGDTPTPPVTASVSLSTNKGTAAAVPVGAVLTASITNPNSADVVWLIGGVETAVAGTSYTVTASDLGKEIQVKLVKNGEDEAVSGKFTVEKSAEVDVSNNTSPVQITDQDTKLYTITTDENGVEKKEEVTVSADDKLVLSVEPKAVTQEEAAEKVTGNEAAKTVLVTAVENAMKEVAGASSTELNDTQKADLAAATQVVAVDVDLTLVQTNEEGQTTETAVHPVGNTKVTLSAAQLGLAGEDLSLYHFNANHTNANGVVQNIPGVVNTNTAGVGVSVTFVTNGLSTIWIGNVPPRTVEFNTQGGSAVASQRVRFGSTVDTGKVGTPTKAGYIFCGWNYDLAKTPIIYNMTGDLAVRAKWVAGTVIPVGRYTVTLSQEPTFLTKDAADGKYTIKADPEATYVAGITAAASVTPYSGATQYVASASAETAASTTDPDQFTQIADAASITLTPDATVTDNNGKVVAGKTSYYIKWMDTAGNVLALEELLVVVDDGQGAAETKVVTRNINRGVGTFEPYLTSSTKADAPNWMGYINGDPERQYSNSSSEWEYRLRTNVRFENRFSNTNYVDTDYDTFHLEFTPFSGESYSGKSVSAQALHYVRDTHRQETVTATAAVNANDRLEVSVPLTSFTEPDTSSYINFTVQVTVGDVTQEINVGALNPNYKDAIRTSHHEDAANLTELRTHLASAAADSNTWWNITYTGAADVTLTDALTIPSNARVYFPDYSFTVGNGGVLTMQSEEDRASHIGINGEGESFTVANGGKLVAFDTRTGEQEQVWDVGVSAYDITVANGGTVEVKPHSALDFSGFNYEGNSSQSQCVLEPGSQVALDTSGVDGAHFGIYSFKTVSMDGAVDVQEYCTAYVHSDTISVGGSILSTSSYWSNVEFYGDVTVAASGKIQVSGQNANLNLQCPLVNEGEIKLENGAYGILTNTGFVQRNSGTISIGSGSTVNLEGTKLVNTGTITGSGNVYAMLGDDVTDYAANHTGLEYVRVSGTETPSNYSRYKFTGEPAKTIDVTLYKGDISNEQGGTMSSSIQMDIEDFPQS